MNIDPDVLKEIDLLIDNILEEVKTAEEAYQEQLEQEEQEKKGDEF